MAIVYQTVDGARVCSLNINESLNFFISLMSRRAPSEREREREPAYRLKINLYERRQNIYSGVAVHLYESRGPTIYTRTSYVGITPK